MIVLFGFVHLLPALVFGSSPLVEKPTGPLIKELYDSCLAAHASDRDRALHSAQPAAAADGQVGWNGTWVRPISLAPSNLLER